MNIEIIFSNFAVKHFACGGMRAAEGGSNWVSRTDSFVMPEAVAKGELHPLRNPAGDPD